MENIHGFSSFVKPVISWHIWHGNARYAGTDIIIFTILQKRENRRNDPPRDNTQIQPG